MLEQIDPRVAAPSVRRVRGYRVGCLVVETAPRSGPVRATAVLVLPPLGYEETCSYRPLRVLADVLAGDGYVVQRPDWPGLGDASGGRLDPDLMARAVAAVRALAAALRGRGFARVVGIGVRAGGLAGLAAGGLDGLVLWGTPASGRRFLREQKAFHNLAARMFSAAPPDAPALPEGAQEAGGFVFPPASVAALQAIDAPKRLAEARLERVLLVPREGAGPPVGLVEALDGAGIRWEASEAGGVGALLEDPYRAALEPAVAAALQAWLGAWSDTCDPSPAELDDTLVLPDGVRERVWTAPGGAGELVGVICEPQGGAPPGASWTVFYNAGGVRRSGPNRLWTRGARALAARGAPSLRMDVRDVGDADGVSVPHSDLEAMYAADSVADALAGFDAVKALDAGSVDVVGLCSGAFLGAQVSAVRPVRRALLFNGLAFVWDEEARASSFTAHIRASLFDRRRWVRLLTGRIDARALASATVRKSGMKARDTLDRLRGRPPTSPVARLLRGILDAGVDLQLVSSDGDPSIAYLDQHLGDGGPRPPLRVLPGVDHTIRPVWSHDTVVQLILGDISSEPAASRRASPEVSHVR